MAGVSRNKKEKKTFTECRIDVLVSEVEANSKKKYLVVIPSIIKCKEMRANGDKCCHYSRITNEKADVKSRQSVQITGGSPGLLELMF